MFFRKPLIVTHNNQFHADDVCAVAVLHLVLGGKYRLVRTRDAAKIEEADYVVDVGGIHDASRRRFDHHQKGGAGERPNGIPYAAFGLVWKEYGVLLTGSEAAARHIDDAIVAPFDASDNGFEICDPRVKGISPFSFSYHLTAFNPLWDEAQDFDAGFKRAVEAAVPMIKRAIQRAVGSEKGNVLAEADYQKAEDKKIIEIAGAYPWREAIMSHPEPLFVIRKNIEGETWGARAVPVAETGFANRKEFPVEWAGLSDGELARVSGVPDAIFCHNKRFLAVAKTREGALALARKAVEA